MQIRIFYWRLKETKNIFTSIKQANILHKHYQKSERPTLKAQIQEQLQQANQSIQKIKLPSVQGINKNLLINALLIYKQSVEQLLEGKREVMQNPKVIQYGGKTIQQRVDEMTDILKKII
ncbi:hypothetical protein pb186bvf_002265 [Paramecium bursaria]